MFRRRVDCPHVHPTADPDRWVLTFGSTGATRQAIWYRPHPSSATTVVTIDLERLVPRAVASANCPEPVHTWPLAKLEHFCATQFATFERPEHTELEMPSLSLQPDLHQRTWRQWLGPHHQVAITNGRNRMSIARHLGARCVPVEVPAEQGDILERLIGCRCRSPGVF